MSGLKKKNLASEIKEARSSEQLIQEKGDEFLSLALPIHLISVKKKLYQIILKQNSSKALSDM